ncbi:hypothetical protein ABVT39_027677 [Epinephelus coioides]
MASDSGKGEKLSLEMVMIAIQESKEELSKQIDTKTTTIQSLLTKIDAALSTLADQVEEMEGRISANKDNIKDATTHVEKLEKEVKVLKDKVDDLENRSWRNNIQILNLPEKAEGSNATGFIDGLIPGKASQRRQRTAETETHDCKAA